MTAKYMLLAVVIPWIIGWGTAWLAYKIFSKGKD